MRAYYGFDSSPIRLVSYNEEEESVGYSYIKGLYVAVSRRNRLVGFQQSSATRGKQTVQHEGHGEDYFLYVA